MKGTSSILQPGSFVRRLTWLPDGTHLLLEESHGDTSSLSIISPLGTPVRVLREDARDGAPSPDGKKIAFLTRSSKELWLVDVDGGGARKVVRVGSGHLSRPRWSPRGERIAFARMHDSVGVYLADIESCDLNGTNPTTILKGIRSTYFLLNFDWLPDGRLIYNYLPPTPTTHDVQNLWALSVDPRSGRPTGKPHQVTKWTQDFTVGQMTSTKDGNRLALIRGAPETNIYVGNLSPDGTQVTAEHRFTLDDRMDSEPVWSRDGRTIFFMSDRSGHSQIYRQDLSGGAAEAISGSLEMKLRDGFQQTPSQLRLSPDGSSILYLVGLTANDSLAAGIFSECWLMRLSTMDRGAPEPVLKTKTGDVDFDCAQIPGGRCVICESPSVFSDTTVVTEFDPINGRGPELVRYVKGELGFWAISPEGKRVASADADTLRILPLDGSESRSLAVRQYRDLGKPIWTPAGNALILDGSSPSGKGMIRVDLIGNVGNARLLQDWPLPPVHQLRLSPDGRHIAFVRGQSPRNVWMIEGF